MGVGKPCYFFLSELGIKAGQLAITGDLSYRGIIGVMIRIELEKDDVSVGKRWGRYNKTATECGFNNRGQLLERIERERTQHAMTRND